MAIFRKKNRTPVNHGVAKVPMIMQLEALECGAACLAMVLAYYRKWVPLEQVRLDYTEAQIDAMTAASAATADEAIKAEIEKAKAKVVAAREACRKAMAILSDSTF